jgi:parvulin-like peptidyl-prolyl isomerase
MRRISLHAGALSALAGISLAACSKSRDAFTAHADVAAEAGSMELSSERLANILSGAAGQQQMSREAGTFVASTWVEYALLAQAVARNELPTDSASIAEAVWPEIAELRGTHWHDTLMSRNSAVTPAAADSLYNTTDQRLLQHILIRVQQNAEPAARATGRRKAETTLTRLKGGADFSRLAVQVSEDPSSRPDSGFLPVSPRGRFVASFDSAAWTLKPGEMTGLVETPYGYHIIKRPALNTVRARLEDFLLARAGVRLDSLYMDSLAAANKVEVKAGAPAAMREAAEDPKEWIHSDKPLATFTGGALTVQEYLRWVRALPTSYGAQLRQANDSLLRQFAGVLAKNVLLLRAADSAGITISPEEWKDLRAQYLAQLDTLKSEMGLTVPDVTDSTIAVREREKVAALIVEKYFDDLVGGKIRLRPLPSALASLLKEKLPYEIHDAGVNRAVELAQQKRAQADSGAKPGGMMRPAPGGPPIPGATPPRVGAPRPGQGGPPAATPPAAKDSAR